MWSHSLFTMLRQTSQYLPFYCAFCCHATPLESSTSDFWVEKSLRFYTTKGAIHMYLQLNAFLLNFIHKANLCAICKLAFELHTFGSESLIYIYHQKKSTWFPTCWAKDIQMWSANPRSVFNCIWTSPNSICTFVRQFRQ